MTVLLKISDSAKSALMRVKAPHGYDRLAFSLDDIAPANIGLKPELSNGLISNENEIRSLAIAAARSLAREVWELELTPVDLTTCEYADLIDAEGFKFLLRKELHHLLAGLQLDFTNDKYFLTDGVRQIRSITDLVEGRKD